MSFSRITVDPNKMGGEPCIRGFRLPVATIVNLIADGRTRAEILAEWDFLEEADIVEALRYAAEASRVRLLAI